MLLDEKALQLAKADQEVKKSDGFVLEAGEELEVGDG